MEPKYIRTPLKTKNIFHKNFVSRPGAGGQPVGGASPALFENQKKCPDIREKGPYCVHPYVKFTTQNAVFRESKRKNFKIFPKCLLKCPNFTKPPLPWKISGCASEEMYRYRWYNCVWYNTGHCVWFPSSHEKIHQWQIQLLLFNEITHNRKHLLK